MSVQGKLTVLVMLLLALQLTFAQQSARLPDSRADRHELSNPSPTASRTPNTGILEVLTDTQGVDFGPYLKQLVSAVKKNWFESIPEQAKPPVLQRGQVAIQFVIMPNGRVAGMQYTESSGDIALDRAAWGSITASEPFLPLPEKFHGPYFALRMHFAYNPIKANVPEQKTTAPPAATSASH